MCTCAPWMRDKVVLPPYPPLIGLNMPSHAENRVSGDRGCDVKQLVHQRETAGTSAQKLMYLLYHCPHVVTLSVY